MWRRTENEMEIEFGRIDMEISEANETRQVGFKTVTSSKDQTRLAVLVKARPQSLDVKIEDVISWDEPAENESHACCAASNESV